jgi:hypothetical protein
MDCRLLPKSVLLAALDMSTDCAYDWLMKCRWKPGSTVTDLEQQAFTSPVASQSRKLDRHSECQADSP